MPPFAPTGTGEQLHIAGRSGPIDNQESTIYGELRGDIQIFVERNFT